jgi:plasmanylethanolamine desaturase
VSAVPGYCRSQRVLESCAIGVFAALAGWSLWRLALAVGWYLPGVMLVATVCGWLAVDLMSGLLHWAFDCWGSVRTPVLGSAFIRPFREHHVDPQLMTTHDFVELNGASCIVCVPILITTCVVPLAARPWIALQALMLFTALGALITNQCHQWAHAEPASTPQIVRWAQRHRLILQPAHHRLHHTAPFDSHFCMASGWLNAPLNAVLRAWR